MKRDNREVEVEVGSVGFAARGRFPWF